MVKHKKKAAAIPRRKSTPAAQLSKIRKFFYRYKRMPSYSEVAELLHYSSKFAAQYTVNKWIKSGVITKDATGKLIPGSAFQPLKVLGSLKAGWPSPAEEENAETISLDNWLIENKEASFMLKVSDDSMIDAGIRPSDMVIINRSRQPKSGDIVVTEVDRKWLPRYFLRQAKPGSRSYRPVLKAANRAYRPIYPKEELKVAGVVTAVIRKY